MPDDFVQPIPPDSEEETVPITEYSEEEWVEKLKLMDNDAWDNLLRNYAGDLRQIISRQLYRQGLSAQWVDDIEQEIWRTVVRKIDDFEWKSKGQLFGWLKQMAVHHISNLRRKLKEQESIDKIRDDVTDTGMTLDFFFYVNGLYEDSAEREVTVHETWAVIEEALQHLKERDREIVIRRLLLQETPREIAERFNMKAATVSVILVRAKKVLRTLIDKPDYHPDFPPGD